MTLDERRVWVDLWGLDRVLAAIDRLGPQPTRERCAELAETMQRLYTGPLLASESDATWALGPADRIRSRITRAIEKLSTSLITMQAAELACELHEFGLEKDPTSEPLFQGLIRCQLSRGRSGEAVRVFERCRRTLAAEFGVEPAPETRALLEGAHRHQPPPDG